MSLRVEKERLVSMLNYLEEWDKINRTPVFDVGNHVKDGLVAWQSDLERLPGVHFNRSDESGEIWIEVERRLKERRERKNLFTVEFLKTQIAQSPIDALFDETKTAYRADKIFADDERINLRPATIENIVHKLENYNLSDTGEDIKGIASERFLGTTFRGDIGQYFTPPNRNRLAKEQHPLIT